jgi:ammonium transporter, Amt family
MKTKILLFPCLLFALTMPPLALRAAEASPPAAPAVTAVPKLKAPGVEERLADLEAYVNNAARANAANTNLDTKVGGPGPGHNAFQMVCAALVLFMTLPGLALFYGGLVRKKNVLSVLAQCLGIDRKSVV